MHTYSKKQQAELKEKHETLLNFVCEILEAVKNAEIKRLDTKKKQCKIFQQGILQR